MATLGFDLVDPDSSALTLLAAVWPAGHRAWLPDRSIRVQRLWSDTGWSDEREWTPALSDEVEAEINADLAAGGIPPRPLRRLWFVRLPDGYRRLASYSDSLVRRGTKAGLSVRSTDPQWVSFVRRTVAEDFYRSA